VPVSTQGFEKVVHVAQIDIAPIPKKIRCMTSGRMDINIDQRKSMRANPILYCAQGIKKRPDAYQISAYLLESL
jgi:hypothetical protein